MAGNTEQPPNDVKKQLELQSQRIDRLEARKDLHREFFSLAYVIAFIFLAVSSWYLVGEVVAKTLTTQKASVLVAIVAGWCVLVITAVYFFARKDDGFH